MPGRNVPFPPMEAELVRELPTGEGWQYEPKWDGFRGVLENDGGELALWSRNERPLLRYFPELRPLGDLLPPHSALDGEIVISRDGVLDFDAMQTRLHPAESRVKRLSGEIPAIFIAFDLLLWDKQGRAQATARGAARGAAARRRGVLDLAGRARARRGDSLARPLRGDRARRRDREAPRAAVPPGLARGRRQGEGAQDGGLRRRRRALEGEAGHGSRRSCSASTARTASTDYVGSAAVGAAQPRRDPGARAAAASTSRSERRFSEPNRWGTGELEQNGAAPELVAEVRYDKVQGNRFRHGTKLIRFRPGQGSRAVHVAGAPARAAARATPRSRRCSAGRAEGKDQGRLRGMPDGGRASPDRTLWGIIQGGSP